MNRILYVAALGAVLSTAAESRAQNDDAKKRAAALFAEGRAVMVKAESHTPLLKGELDEACAKLEQSDALVEQGHTALNLAECHLFQGKTATAWREYGHAAEMARRDKFPEAEQAASKAAADLQAKLSFLTITVAPGTAALPGFELTLNGHAEPRDAWGKAVAVDPGTFEVAAKANGYLPFSATSTVGPEGDKREVTVTLAPGPLPPPLSPGCPPPPPPHSDTPVYVGAVFIGTGAVVLAFALGFGVDWRSAQNQLVTLCGPALVCRGANAAPGQMLDARQDRDRIVVATTSGVGMTAVIAGIVGIATRPKGDSAAGSGRVVWSPSVGPSFVGSTWQGVF